MMLAAAAILAAIAGMLILFRIPGCEGGLSGCKPENISVIIPARNEEQNIRKLLRSLHRQEQKPMEVIVVDDGSTDSTAEVAAKQGAKVIRSSSLPGGWTGKNWACHQGAGKARGEFLLFMDADTWFLKDGLLKAAESSGGSALSVVPYHFVKRPYESLSAFFNLLMMMGTGAFTALGDSLEPRGLFGQFLLISAKDYRSSGGHEGVKGRVLENFFMAESLRNGRIPMKCRSGKGTVGMRMYPHGARSLTLGWRKAFTSGASATHPILTSMASIWLSGAMLAFLLLLLSLARVTAYPLWLPYPVFAFQVWRMLRGAGSYGMLTAVLYPVPLVFFFVVFTHGTLRRLGKNPEEWKGRTLSAQGEEGE